MKQVISFRKIAGGFCILAVSMFTACNNDSSTTSETMDTSMIVSDTGMLQETMPAPMAAHAEATLSGTNADTTVDGTVKFDTTAGGKVKMTIDITVPKEANKSVAVHIHEHGDCGDMGKMAHGHWNPTNAQHGKWGSSSFHLGDIGNVKLNGAGKGQLTIETDLWSIGGDESKSILGKSIIVHGGVDDFTTQPTGNAGSRIGCGVIK